MKVVRQRTSQDAMKGKESLLQDNKLFFDRVTYKRISSLTDNKVLEAPTSAESEWERFLIAMESIHDGTNTDTDVALLDQYLGNLGITEVYPFPTDTYYAEEWLDVAEQTLTRNVITSQADIDYNVITNIDGVDYNVAHDTHANTTGVLNG